MNEQERNGDCIFVRRNPIEGGVKRRPVLKSHKTDRKDGMVNTVLRRLSRIGPRYGGRLSEYESKLRWEGRVDSGFVYRGSTRRKDGRRTEDRCGGETE